MDGVVDGLVDSYVDGDLVGVVVGLVEVALDGDLVRVIVTINLVEGARDGDLVIVIVGLLEGALDGDLVGVVVGLLEGALDGKRDGDLVGVVILVEVTDGDTLGAMDELIEGEFVLTLPALMVAARKASKLMEPNPVDGSHPTAGKKPSWQHLLYTLSSALSFSLLQLFLVPPVLIIPTNTGVEAVVPSTVIS